MPAALRSRRVVVQAIAGAALLFLSADATTPVVSAEPVALARASSTAALDLASALIRTFEGCGGCGGPALRVYRDSGGRATIGYGITAYEDGRRVRVGDPPISRERGEALFRHWFRVFADSVAVELPADTPPGDLAAMISLAWNIGVPAFRRSDVAALYRRGNRLAAFAAAESYVRDAGVVRRGLQIRRRAERLVADGHDVVTARALAERAFPLHRGRPELIS